MPTHITQIDDPDAARTVLRVEGSLTLADAELLEGVCRDLRGQQNTPISLDLTDLSFLDSDSASVLYRLKREQGVSLEGIHLFVQKAIDLAEMAALS
ncbi:MAG TPA: STAS domain-containing protein [Pyrinomonadaceae bacterium]|jgi:anti-anti-sigma factor|nr:STAS domain-containing protein [Pyrinomonadaceae bacterium]